MIPTVSFTSLKKPEKGDIVLFVFEGGEHGDSFRVINKTLGDALTRAMVAEDFTGKLGQVCKLVSPSAEYTHVVIVGLGVKEEFSNDKARQVGGAAAKVLNHKTTSITLMTDWDFTEYSTYIALGALLSVYEFNKYCTEKNKKTDTKYLQEIQVLTSDYEAAQKGWSNIAAVAEGSYLTRNLVNEPANHLTPPEFAKRIQELESLGISIEVLGKAEMEKLGFGALLGVAQGSDAEPKTVIMQWKGNPEDKEAPIAFLGKGVTFDSGGISIKPAGGMEDMKMDMAGAATVVGLMKTLATRKAKTNVIGVVGLVENMLSGNAQRPGDIVTSASGQTIEVLNTDAEGRLVLADILWYTQDRFKPRFMINLATLTGAIVVALGYEYAGLFSNNDELSERLSTIGNDIGEKVWRMPMGPAYDKALDAQFADMQNIGGRDGGSITAAQFLQRFVNKTPWVHLDIAGTAYTGKGTNNGPKGATSFGVCLLNQLVKEHYEA
ncbi:Leucyl aminopeptidase (PepB) (PDB:3H8E) (PUBMED:19553197 [Commensalibacter papalotli (ex Botero et al. 2024)]|uniref:Probable cytosol aminopeptidase n=1 Tax=Commensalibacter papalotli (ex Botero et al. 2024) TaxID=2972766 RepID=A0ABM9HNE7_9PROT|nr:leucyl aminopeptidase [Commensalibacter papalotli (ex Botero et al. 2024)]CAI3936972.1 Leucyl aminopeptidase (PepB) (PDB:3H8E) (PUBMED:19553197 [Commensalibacter papalotli (ex Botero et al. 2024)]CAI3938657.1 Leucyl aminopeptidase (PepB) (PDB:3H8E) (PUBMED:19553197 [Commensalibacter papalotli (ex Botero et al. 2024)]